VREDLWTSLRAGLCGYCWSKAAAERDIEGGGWGAGTGGGAGERHEQELYDRKMRDTHEGGGAELARGLSGARNREDGGGGGGDHN